MYYIYIIDKHKLFCYNNKGKLKNKKERLLIMSEEAPQNGQGQPVDETAYQNMEVVAAASGPEAEARRREMEEWSEAAGKYAEGAARITNDEAARVVKRGGREEDVKRVTRYASASLANSGLGNNGEKLKPVGGSTGLDMEIVHPSGTSDVLRSPASFKQNKSESQPVAETTEKPDAA